MKGIFDEIEKQIERCKVIKATVREVKSEFGGPTFANVDMIIGLPDEPFKTLALENVDLNVTAIVGRTG